MRNVDLSLSDEGCLEVRGRSVGETYWPEPSLNLAWGVYRTTDLAQICDGLVWLHGRASDVINVAGRKIAPESIERLLAAHPGVRECLVFGAPDRDAERGDMIVACVAAVNGTTADSLRTFLLERSEAWQVPRNFWFVPAIQANDRGKLSRAEWRQKWSAR
jgi:acyl-coenzyme A synthetase/AMP-(fatty) acid ligase